ncbi:MAG: ankyrin repeat domain-containing protein [Proteobacteria bacterium]|nr:ankyrin repeat domain-containing protein [Pseudomonadota bacterium]
MVVAVLLVLTTWDAWRNIGGSYGEELRRAAFNGDEVSAKRVIAAHPKVINSVNQSAAVIHSLRQAAGRFGWSWFESTEDMGPESFEAMEMAKTSALFLAVIRTNLSTAKFLAEAGADANLRPKGYIPLAFVSMVTLGDTSFLTTLTKHGVRLNLQDPETGHTLFHYAAFKPQELEMHRFLLQCGVPINARSHDGSTALSWAVKFDRLGLVQFLLENGADWTLADGSGYTVLVHAKSNLEVLSKTNAPAIVAILESFAATNKPPPKAVP